METGTGTGTEDQEAETVTLPKGSRVVVIRLRHLVMAALVFVGTFALTQVQIINVSSDARETIDTDSKGRDYLLSLANWATDKVIFDGCQVLVRQNEGSRAWKVWLLDKLEEITPAENDVAIDFIAEGRAKLDELIPVLPASGCINPGDPPEPPPGFDVLETPIPTDLSVTIPTTIGGTDVEG